MRVAVIGGLGPGGMTESIVRGFAAAGCQVELLPYYNWLPDLYVTGVPGTGVLARRAITLARPMVEVRLARALMQSNADLAFFLKCDDLHQSFYPALRKVFSGPLFAFHPDNPFNRSGLFRKGSAHRRSGDQLRAVDWYFVWSNALVERARREGARRASYLPFACDPELHHPVELSESDRRKYQAEVGFVGNIDAEREGWLRALEPFDLGIWGHASPSLLADPVLRKAWRGRAVYGEEMSKAVQGSQISINILRVQNKDACNMRTFELPACGGFMLHERSRELPSLFRPGLECDDFGSPTELREKVGYYLAHPERREAIARAGREKALKHTYKVWAEEILTRYEELTTGGSSNQTRQ